MFKKLLYTLLIILVVVAVIAVGLLIYVRPDRELDWSYTKVSIPDKAWQMAKNFNTELDLSEEEINNLFKERYADKAKLPNNIEITGTHFDLQGDKVVADVNLRWNDLVDVEARIKFDLEWREGTLIIKHSQTNVKALSIPSNLLHIPTVEIPIAQMLPRLVAIKELTFEPNHIHISFRLKH